MRTAGIVCIEDCDFGVIYKEDYDKILKSYQSNKEKKQIQFFSNTIFKNSVQLTKETI